jgi:hypothetical protein
VRPSPQNRAARPGALALAVAAASLGALTGCEDGCAGAASPPDTAAADATASASARGPSPRSSDPRWQRALLDESPLSRAAFADDVGAAALAEGLLDEEPVRGLALDALPHARDAERALGALAVLLERTEGEPRDRVLAVVLAVAAKPPAVGEILDPEGSRACADRVLAIAGDHGAAPSTRALAVSAAHRLADRGWIDPRSIPKDAP